MTDKDGNRVVFVKETGIYLRLKTKVYSTEYGESLVGEVISISTGIVKVKYENESVENFTYHDNPRSRKVVKLLRLVK